MLLLLTRRQQRNIVVFGVAWFIVTILPVLPLRNHLIPYYLFLPLAGLALIVGLGCGWLYDALKSFNPSVGAAAVVAVFATEIFVIGPGIEKDIRENRLLGGSAELAQNSLADMKRLYPELPPNAAVYFNDLSEPLYWDQDWGGLLKLGYRRADPTFGYASEDDLFLPRKDDIPLVFGVRNKHLVDETAAYRLNPGKFIDYVEARNYAMNLSKTDVIAGKESYSLTIDGIRDTVVRVTYRLNAESTATFDARLDSNGTITFPVSADARKGVYRFIAFNIPPQKGWIPANATITVH
jgi:hypothetical protein